MQKWIDLRSDTVTHPTEKMREAMMNAVVGDDVYEDDPTMKKLEAYAAELLEKEAAIFVPSGTFGNQLALFTHCARGNEVILGEDCHIVAHEAGAPAVISGVNLRTLPTTHGKMDLEKIRQTIRPAKDVHWPETGLICLENAYSDGSVLDLAYMQSVRSIADEFHLPVHLDGARLFNAATSLGIEAKAIAACFNSVSFCLSKGLCAPVGSILVGKKSFIDKARYKRKLLGGGMRQVGFLAAAGLVALKEMTGRLAEDHDNAKYLAKKLDELPNIQVNQDGLAINMVFFTVANCSLTDNEVMEKFAKKGIKVNPPENGEMRFVTHYWIKRDDIDYAVAVTKEIFG